MSKQSAIHQIFNLSSKRINALSLSNAFFDNYTFIRIKWSIHMICQLLKKVNLIDFDFEMPDFFNLLMNFIILTIN